MSIYDVFSGGSRAFNKEEWAAAKQEQRREAYELIDNTCAEIAADGGAFQRYLDVQGHFDRYSVNNAILVSAQMPEATQLLPCLRPWRTVHRATAIMILWMRKMKRSLPLMSQSVRNLPCMIQA